VQGNTEIGDLDLQGNMVIDLNSNLVVQNSMLVGESGSLTVQQSDPSRPNLVTIMGTLVLEGGSVVVNIFFSVFVPPARRAVQDLLRLSVATAETEASVVPGSVVAAVQVATYGDRMGAFDNATIVVGDFPGSDCDIYSGPTTAVYGTSTLSVTTNVARDTSRAECELPSDGLSSGAIAGIAVGVTVGVLVIFVVVLLWCRRKELATKTSMFRDAIAKREQHQRADRPL